MPRKIALVILLAFLAAGCRESYKAERAFWWANRDLRNISKAQFNSHGPVILDPVIAKFEAIVEKYPGTPSAVDSLFVVSNLRIRQKKLPEARASLERILRDYPQHQEKVSEARFGIGAIYEVEGYWDKAEEAYWDAAFYTPAQFKGLYAPIHVMNHYIRLKDEAGKTAAYNKALDHYEKLVKQTGPIQVSAAFKNYLALTHYTAGNNESAIKEWRALEKDYAESPFAAAAVMAVAEVYTKMNEPSKALLTYQEFLKKYPKHPLTPNAFLQMAALYMRTGQYPQARELYEKLAAEYFPKDVSKVAQLKLSAASSYQKEGNWEEAEKRYKEIQATWPATPSGMSVPFIIAGHLDSAGEKEKAQAMVKEAIPGLQTIADTAKDPAVRNYAKRLINGGYIQTGDWNQILANIDRDMGLETVPMRRGSWLFLKALITENRLQKKDEADKLYRLFLNQYPDHPLAKQLAQKRPDLLTTGAAGR